MTAEILAIGDEILIGQIVNSNAAWLAQRLNELGVAVSRLTTVGDTENGITGALLSASQNSDLVICTGGLGPTKDDITKQAICKFFNTRLRFDEMIYKDVETLFRSFGKEVTELNRKQAEVPESCIPLRNHHGTAPGLWFSKSKPGGKPQIFIFLPGVPYEMEGIMNKYALPELRKVITEKTDKHHQNAIFHYTVLTTGMGESFLSEKIAAWENGLPRGLRLAYLPSPGTVRLRLSAFGKDQKELKGVVMHEIAKLKKIIPGYIYGFNSDTLESVVGGLLVKRKKTLSTAESCTGGYIAHRITSVPGSSVYFKGSIVSYSDEIKTRELEVGKNVLQKWGAVSEQVVQRMADGVRKKFRTDYSIACSGIAGPGGGTKEKPVGTVWIAVSSGIGTISRMFLFGSNRERNIHMTAIAALNLLRKVVIAKQ